MDWTDEHCRDFPEKEYHGRANLVRQQQLLLAVQPLLDLVMAAAWTVAVCLVRRPTYSSSPTLSAH